MALGGVIGFFTKGLIRVEFSRTERRINSSRPSLYQLRRQSCFVGGGSWVWPRYDASWNPFDKGSLTQRVGCTIHKILFSEI